MSKPNSIRPYQGYPYKEPMVMDAPSLRPDDLAAMEKWKNLPLTKVGNNGASGKSTAPPSTSSETDLAPVVYIDIPDSSESNVSLPNPEPEAELSQTIYYDPFNDRQVDEDSDDDNVWSSQIQQPRPAPSVPSGSSRNVNAAGSSSGTNYVPNYMTKESNVYNPRPAADDGFAFTPIPVSDFPNPPPSYEEIDKIPDAPKVVVESSNQPPEPPRTQVITNPGNTNVIDYECKYLRCHYCGESVQTRVARENGFYTHVLAWSLFAICLFPVTIWIYCSDYCKYKNHYCPNCNGKIGYEAPFVCIDMTLVTYKRE